MCISRYLYQHIFYMCMCMCICVHIYIYVVMYIHVAVSGSSLRALGSSSHVVEADSDHSLCLDDGYPSRWTRITLQHGADGILQTAHTVRECHKNALKSSSIAHVYTIYICVLMNASQKKSGISIHLSPKGFSPAEVPKLCLPWWASSLYRGVWWAHQWPVFSNPGKVEVIPETDDEKSSTNGRVHEGSKPSSLKHLLISW